MRLPWRHRVRPADEGRHVLDDSGRLIPVEYVGAHCEKPDLAQACMNGLLGMPIPYPWYWGPRVTMHVEWFSAWAGERCVAITHYPCAVIDGSLTFAMRPVGGSTWEPVALPNWSGA